MHGRQLSSTTLRTSCGRALRPAALGLVAALTALAALAPAPASAQGSASRPIPVNIESNPPGATVYYQSVDPANRIGTTPITAARIPRGQRVLIFQLEGHEEKRLEVRVQRRRETFTATLEPFSVINITGANEAASGAAVRVDGEPVGNVPYRGRVEPGRHLVQVGREGHRTFSQWVELSGGQVLTLPVLLEAEQAPTGSLLVAGDTPGAQIFLDGAPRGTTPTVLDDIPAGEHVLEVRSTDPNLEPFRQTVRVIAGERLTIAARLQPATAAGGSLRVLATPRGAVVSVDGEVIGEAPAGREGLSPGEHIVTVEAEGYQRAEQTVTIEDGRQRVISVTLDAIGQAPGRIVVNANVDRAEVFIDGEPRGSVPVVVSEPPAGTHAIVVRAEGYQEYRRTCSVGPGLDCDVDARLEPIGTPVRVEANVSQAQLYVDGELEGPVPWEGTLPVGSHRIEVRAPGYRTYEAQVALRPSADVRIFNVGLVGENELSVDERRAQVEQRRERHTQAVSRSGATLPADLAVLDFSLGWPHLFEFRLGIGILDWLEAGIGFRTFGRLTEFEGRVKAGYRPVRQISVGGQVRIGGGLGPARDARDFELDDLESVNGTRPADLSFSTNTFFVSMEGLFSLHFLRAGNFTLWVGADFIRDGYGFNATASNCRFGSEQTVTVGGNEVPICDATREQIEADPDYGTAELRQAARLDDSQGLGRIRIGGSLEFILNERWNAWGAFEGVLTSRNRRIFGDVFGLGNADLRMYFRLGATYKFGVFDDRTSRQSAPEPEPEPELAPEPTAPAG
ncbi:MAG: PEGA domain-containing protein [Myxococcota bacterium]